MAIVKMKRLRCAAALSAASELIPKLTHLGCVEISTAEIPNDSLFKLSTETTDVTVERERLIKTIGILKKYLPKKSPPPKKASVTEEHLLSDEVIFNAVSIADEVDSVINKLSSLQDSISKKREIIALLEGFAKTDIPLDFADRKSFSVIFASGLGKLELPENIAAFYEVSAANGQNHAVILVHKSAEKAVSQALSEAGLRAQSFAGMSGTAAENIKMLSSEISSAEREKSSLNGRILQLASEIPEIEKALDAIAVREFMDKSRAKFAQSSRTAYFEGWLAAGNQPKVEKLLQSLGCAFEFSEPQGSDNVPIILKNNPLTAPLNTVTEMYSLPSYDGIDPNGILLPFFTAFFGIMFADIGYGLVLMLASAIILKKMKPSGNFKSLMGLMLLCGIMTTVFGFVFGGFFGDAVPVISESFFGDKKDLWRLIDPLSDPLTVLIMSIAIGFFQLIVGMAVKGYMLIRDGKPLDAVLDVGSWWVLFAGIALFALGKGYWLIIVGVAALVLTQGRDSPSFFGKLLGGVASLYGLISFMSDALSYARLMALLLATSVIASVVNILAALSGSPIIFAVIFIVGHLFNMAVNIIGTYVHAARLQYLEFFGRFYKAGGKAFRPLAVNTKFVNVIKEEK